MVQICASLREQTVPAIYQTSACWDSYECLPVSPWATKRLPVQHPKCVCERELTIDIDDLLYMLR